MIRVEDFTAIEQIRDMLTPSAAEEVKAAGKWAQWVLDHSEVTGIVTLDEVPLLAAGVRRQTLMGTPPEIWALPTRFLKARHMRFLRPMFEELREYFPQLRATFINTDSPGCRMVKFFGFKERYSVYGKTVYEVR